MRLQTGSEAGTRDEAVRRHGGGRVPAAELLVVPAEACPRVAVASHNDTENNYSMR